ncbi:hypothetical protein [Burkholderia cenocepacia]|nr:hypothetical protein [Burkholderia cenocepacia]
MNVLNETAEQVFLRLTGAVGPKARVSLERIKVACDRIESMRGLMNYSRVAAVTTELFGSPRAQTIQNSKELKAYIAMRVGEYREHSRPNDRRAKFPRYATRDRSPYPVEGLDSKTRLFIDFMAQDNERLETENRRLAQLLERETERRPVSLAEAFGRGPTVELGLAVELTGETHDIPACLTDALHVIMGGTATHFEVQRRGEAMRVVYEHNGIRHTLLTPSQWKEVQDWLGTV